VDLIQTLLSKRYLINGEDKLGMYKRVARAVAAVSVNIYNEPDPYQDFLAMMVQNKFIPNTPCLANAGKENGQLSACFVIPIPDDISGIFDAVKLGAMVHKTGGGTGFSFSRLRPAGDKVETTKGIASGPISFARVFNAATHEIKQGGMRRGANMGVLRVDHPNIQQWVEAKSKPGELENFNLSVGLTDKFMRAVENNTDFELINPRTGEVASKIRAKELFDLMIKMSWSNGEPGFLFLDRINKDNPLKQLIEATNPCGEVPLLPYESCNLASINLGEFVVVSMKGLDIDWFAFACVCAELYIGKPLFYVLAQEFLSDHNERPTHAQRHLPVW